uniref:NPL4 homolog, ubiquitin recognition factor n=1 Tax=Astatotilapia calliptera TaxID=8154 RepID=A0AAX7TW01_ASTCA
MANGRIIRVQSPEGMKKIPSTKRETAAAFLKKVAKEFGFNSNGFSVYLNRNKTGELVSQNKTLSLLKIKHGDMLFLFPSESSTSSGEVMDTATPHTSSSLPSVQEDEIDQYLAKQDGRGPAKLDPCLKKPNNSPEYHTVYVNVVFLSPPQKYRHVDNIMFENHTIADRFLDFWRKTGSQRMGYLYGRYTEHTDIPLGIRAEVAAIYEPPQNATQNSLELLDDPKAAAVDEIAAKLGMCKVGWIFTDLLSEDTRIGTVRYSRNSDSYYLSAEECITAGYFQNEHSNPCRLSRDGHFGSKFVTVVATGGPDNQVHFEGYQVSNQCMALVRDECLLPCKDAPELGYAQESSPEQYVPDVFYKDKDKFGNDVTFLARPLPVEYLLIDITTTFPKDPQYTFSSTQRFPIENRDILGETQDFHSLATYLSQCTSTSFLNIVSDFHLLLFLVTNEVMPLRDSIGLLLEAVKTSNEDLAQTWKKSEQWATIEQLCSTVGGQPSSSLDYGAMGGPSVPASSSAMWSCLHCTFMNQPGTEHCEMCSLPRS